MDETKITEILEHYSPESQKIKAIEELAELQSEIARNLNGQENTGELRCEMADVLIMIVQIMVLCDITPKELDNAIAFKLDRQLKRIKEGK